MPSSVFWRNTAELFQNAQLTFKEMTPTISVSLPKLNADPHVMKPFRCWWIALQSYDMENTEVRMKKQNKQKKT